MPYESRDDLPDSVRDNLPAHAQDVEREAFNAAWERYAEPDDRQGQDSREATALKVAWGAVKKAYVKDGDRWVRRHD